MEDRIAHNVARIRERIAGAAQRAGRSASEVTLVAVAKTRSVSEITAAYQAGIRHVGENRVEEAAVKRPDIDLLGLTWHMVGHLQSRKAGRAIELFDVLHSVDSVRLADRLDRLLAESGKTLPTLIEVNVSGEETKYGFSLADREALFSAVEQILALRHLSLRGLMTVAFVARDPEEVRPVFARLRELGDSLGSRYPEAGWDHLSMGMTDDFEVAIEEGATMVRIGRAIFGPRE